MLLSGAPRDPRILELWFSALTALPSPALHLCTLLRVPEGAHPLRGPLITSQLFPPMPHGAPQNENLPSALRWVAHPKPTSNFQGKEFRCGAGRN